MHIYISTFRSIIIIIIIIIIMWKNSEVKWVISE
jgi:hypothetical protein